LKRIYVGSPAPRYSFLYSIFSFSPPTFLPFCLSPHFNERTDNGVCSLYRAHSLLIVLSSFLYCPRVFLYYGILVCDPPVPPQLFPLVGWEGGGGWGWEGFKVPLYLGFGVVPGVARDDLRHEASVQFGGMSMAGELLFFLTSPTNRNLSCVICSFATLDSPHLFFQPSPPAMYQE